MLGALLAVGGGTAIALRHGRPIGREIKADRLVAEILNDRVSPSLGPVSADVTMAVFTDFNCPACRLAHPAMMEAIEADGRSRLIFKDWPVLGPASREAARIAIAANAQGLTEPLRSAMMSGGAAGPSSLDLVARLGGDPLRLKQMMAEQAQSISELLALHHRHAFALGLQGTPSHLLGSWLIEGAASARQFRRMIEHVRGS